MTGEKTITSEQIEQQRAELIAAELSMAQHHRELARSLKSGMFAEKFPLDDAEVLLFAEDLGYEVSEKLLWRYLEKGYINSPRELNGQRSWTERNIVQFVDALETRRAWAPCCPTHEAKKTYFEKLAERAEGAGEDSPFADLDQYTLEDLLLLMRTANVQPVRDLLFVAIKSKLDLNA